MTGSRALGTRLTPAKLKQCGKCEKTITIAAPRAAAAVVFRRGRNLDIEFAFWIHDANRRGAILMKHIALALSLTLLCGAAAAQTPSCDLHAYKSVDGLKAEVAAGIVTLTWQGESEVQLRAQFGIRGGQPFVLQLAIQKKGGPWVVLGKNLSPDFQVTTGRRRISSKQLALLKQFHLDTPEEIEKRKWNTFWDAPLVVPGEG